MSASDVKAQVLLVPSAEVAVLTGKGLGPCGHREDLHPRSPPEAVWGPGDPELILASHYHAWTDTAVHSGGLNRKDQGHLHS